MKKIFKIFALLFLITNTNCQNNDFDDTLKLPEVIKKEDQLFELLENITKDETDPTTSITCIDFIYPFQLLIYNQNLQVINLVTLTGDEMFSELLGNLPSNNSISISYPLQTTLSDGTVFIVNNNAELKLAIDACSKEDIISNCSDLFGSPTGTCVWKVPFLDNENNDFAGAVFTANPNGTINIFHLNNTYVGTWVFLFIDDKLYLNINISGTSTVATAWNLNYEILVFENDLFKIKSNNITRTLIKTCKDSEEYEIGDMGPKGGIIAFKKVNYTNGWQYIEVAQNDFQNEEWGCFSSNIIESQFNQIGTGIQNTYANLNFHNNLNNYYVNPSICSNLNNGTLASKTAKNTIISNAKDWFIPSKDEFESIYNNLHPLNLGNFANSNYWTSTEANTNNAVVINMQTGVVSNSNKNSLQTKTRVIRYF